MAQVEKKSTWKFFAASSNCIAIIWKFVAFRKFYFRPGHLHFLFFKEDNIWFDLEHLTFKRFWVVIIINRGKNQRSYVPKMIMIILAHFVIILLMCFYDATKKKYNTICDALMIFVCREWVSDSSLLAACLVHLRRWCFTQFIH